jgi:DNA-binding transcriptional ArsR family regulator
MGISKLDNYTEQELKLAELAKAIAHPARVAILLRLAKQGSCICNDIVLELPLAQATISQHLKELKNVGLVKGEVEGTKVCYCINEEQWNIAKKMMNDMFNQLELKIVCC